MFKAIRLISLSQEEIRMNSGSILGNTKCVKKKQLHSCFRPKLIYEKNFLRVYFRDISLKYSKVGELRVTEEIVEQ